MYFRYPVRNFRCPFCGAKMPTEQYKGWKPWICPGCSQELQFSETYGWVVQLFFLGVALLLLYLLGFRGWQLLGFTAVAGFLLTVIFIGPLGRIIPPRLESYRPREWPHWRSSAPSDGSILQLFPREDIKIDESDSSQTARQRSAVEKS